MNKHIDRYKPVRKGFWWKVQIGDGEQAIGKCYTEVEAERLAAALQRSFWNGGKNAEDGLRLARYSYSK